MKFNRMKKLWVNRSLLVRNLESPKIPRLSCVLSISCIPPVVPTAVYLISSSSSMFYENDFNHQAAFKSRKSKAIIANAWATVSPAKTAIRSSLTNARSQHAIAIVRLTGIDKSLDKNYEQDVPFPSSKCPTKKRRRVAALWDAIGVTASRSSSHNNDDDDAETPLWKHYCGHSTLHGFQYLVTPTLRLWQRLVWLTLIGMASAGILYVSLLVQRRYTANGLATIVESTVYPIAEIPYPAVMVCNYNRVNWQRVPAAIDA